MLIPQEIIRTIRDKKPLLEADIQAFVGGITDNSVSDAQIAAFTMATFLNGMSDDEIVYLTNAMKNSGKVLSWPELDGYVVDKHSTGGVGDLVSLVLGPLVAAADVYVPMIAGKGLGHTGGTIDKLHSIPGYNTYPDEAEFRKVVKDLGIAIIGQTSEFAPADRRVYSVRDISATVESIPLVTASILSKKLAEGLDGLVMDVKVGSGAIMPTFDQSKALAQSIARVANLAGVNTRVLLTDMSQPLSNSAGNALEMIETIKILTGKSTDTRLIELILQQAASMISIAKDMSLDDAYTLSTELLSSGKAAEKFAKMVASMGGPADLLEHYTSIFAPAPIIKPVLATHTGIVQAIDAREVGMSVVALGGGRRHPEDALDYRVGITEMLPVGTKVEAGQPIAMVHANSEESLIVASQRLVGSYQVGDSALAEIPLILESF
ncbi:thymidine phosphorylase [Flocculibacter collagenilyticus]|uniref:thymidine phosphorylase n=1 Tax=Flocculibacter collagenilyticus TaxID=2744479 RepID=UPI0018F31F1B|nr:thymidine phosphorylase [Flocculibacter collagenilyticus]